MSTVAQVGVEVLGGRRCLVERRPGDGDPVVFVNGCGLPYEFWAPVAERLSRPVVLFNRPGIGTPRPDEPQSLAAEVATLRDLLADAPGATVAAHSMASLHVEALQLEHPGLIGGLAMVDPSVEWTSSRAWPSEVLGVGQVARWLGRSRVSDELIIAGAKAMTRLQTAEPLSASLREVISTTYADPEALAAVAAEFVDYRQQANDLIALRDHHELVTVPTTILTARKDFTSEEQRRYAARFEARQVIVQHSRHLVMLDAPRAVVAAINAPGGTGA